MHPASAQTRSVIVGLLLAALATGSLIAFSLVAGTTTTPPTAAVAARAAQTKIAALTFPGSDEVLGQPVRSGTATRVEGGSVETRVLGTRVQKHDRAPVGHDKADARDAPPKDTPCDCSQSSTGATEEGTRGHGNGHAYGHYKDKSNGNAYGHYEKVTSGRAGPKKK